jgi:hypothetical protein
MKNVFLMIGLILGIASVILCTFCAIYAYNMEMWYELGCTIGGCILMLYCSYLFATCGNPNKEDEDLYV